MEDFKEEIEMMQLAKKASEEFLKYDSKHNAFSKPSEMAQYTYATLNSKEFGVLYFVSRFNDYEYDANIHTINDSLRMNLSDLETVLTSLSKKRLVSFRLNSIPANCYVTELATECIESLEYIKNNSEFVTEKNKIDSMF